MLWPSEVSGVQGPEIGTEILMPDLQHVRWKRFVRLLPLAPNLLALIRWILGQSSYVEAAVTCRLISLTAQRHSPPLSKYLVTTYCMMTKEANCACNSETTEVKRATLSAVKSDVINNESIPCCQLPWDKMPQTKTASDKIMKPECRNFKSLVKR